MLDTPEFSVSPSCADWRDDVSYGDIVLFRFPGAGRPAAARPAVRPCLVLDVETLNTRRCAVLVPAFPAHHAGASGRALVLRGRAEYGPAGLERPMRFPIRSRLIVPLEHDGFAPSKATGTPLVGRLCGDAVERMNVERARIHALRDIRAERACAHAPQRRGARRGRDFTVERRGRRRPIPAAPHSAIRSGG
ncbi:hypothetical protein D6850_18170 [Roseovarius spongiae]|uniref:Uncharacterized protein n=1 Tax=Roseovarius spongiae TaxID=2320272 RepID=A0A3A8AST3_9RHOB|nr:hypothetical protein [Roseovarius spongiae]RKF12398.1 hypothetical protein D6850_18170 [Roseovarius spongiae]